MEDKHVWEHLTLLSQIRGFVRFIAIVVGIGAVLTIIAAFLLVVSN